MTAKQEKIGILGGTFDPVHLGHLFIAEKVREIYDLERVVFIPSGIPPHKTVLQVTSPEHRYRMVCEALKGTSGLEVSRLEIEREGYTYSIDTLKSLKILYGESTKLFFIVGADVITDLLTWKDFKSVFKMCEFIAVLRPGFVKTDFLKEIHFLRSTYNAEISTAELPTIDISSTCIRENVKSGRPIKDMVPGSVEKYIIENALYR